MSSIFPFKLICIWWWLISDVSGRIIMLATFFRNVGDFLNVLSRSLTCWIGHQHLKLVINTFGLQDPSPSSWIHPNLRSLSELCHRVTFQRFTSRFWIAMSDNLTKYNERRRRCEVVKEIRLVFKLNLYNSFLNNLKTIPRKAWYKPKSTISGLGFTVWIPTKGPRLTVRVSLFKLNNFTPGPQHYETTTNVDELETDLEEPRPLQTAPRFIGNYRCERSNTS